MRDYTYQDMLRMQEDAANRVREMKKRAALAMDEEPKISAKQVPIPDEVRHISYPVEIDSPVTEKSEEDEEKNEMQHGIIDFITQDKDVLLVLSLIALLSAENNDYITSCALLYLLL